MEIHEAYNMTPEEVMECQTLVDLCRDPNVRTKSQCLDILETASRPRVGMLSAMFLGHIMRS